MNRNTGIYLAGCLLGLLFLFRGGIALWQSNEARGWSVVDGAVTESQAGWVKHPLPNHQGPWSYELRVRYVYAVAGRDYAGSRVRFSPWGPNENFSPSIPSILRKYAAGTRTHVHVDPRNPSLSVLDPAPPPDDWSFLLLGAAFLLVGIHYGRRGQARS